MKMIVDKSRSHPEALKRYRAGEQFSASTDIMDITSYGYGDLDDLGFWEFPLYFDFVCEQDGAISFWKTKAEQYKKALEDIAEFGHKNPGCGHSCSQKAIKALNDNIGEFNGNR